MARPKGSKNKKVTVAEVVREMVSPITEETPSDNEINAALAAGVMQEIVDPKIDKPIFVEVMEYNDSAIRLEIGQVLTKRLPDLYDRYINWIAKNDVAQGRWKPTFEHFMRWLNEYYG